VKTDGYADAVHRVVATRSEGTLLIVRPVTTGPPWMHACGAKFQPGAMMIQQKDGTFKESDTALFNMFAISEDVDAVFDITETGTTLIQNNLKIIDQVMESTAVLIANKDALKDPIKKEKIIDMIVLLKGVVEARKKLHIFVNVEKDNLEELLRILPSLKGPTISNLSKEGWYGVNTIIDKNEFIRLIPTIRKVAQGLVILEPSQILSMDKIILDDKDEIKFD